MEPMYTYTYIGGGDRGDGSGAKAPTFSGQYLQEKTSWAEVMLKNKKFNQTKTKRQ